MSKFKTGDIVNHVTNLSVKWVVIRTNHASCECRCVKYNNDVIEYKFFEYELNLVPESENKPSKFTTIEHYGDER